MDAKVSGKTETMSKIKTAVVTGGHEYDVMDFHRLLRSMPELDAYPQHMEDFVTDATGSRSSYDALVFYNMQLATPGEDRCELGIQTREALEEVIGSQKGIVLLHHALGAYPNWELWSDLCGIRERSGIPGYTDQTVPIRIAGPRHPITTGLTPWELVDETYVMDDAGKGSEVLLTTDLPRSMKTIAWTRRHGNARVFCYQSGHDQQTYTNAEFRTVLTRGIQWVAGRI